MTALARQVEAVYGHSMKGINSWSRALLPVLVWCGFSGCAGSSFPPLKDFYIGEREPSSGQPAAQFPDSLTVVSYNIAFAEQTDLAARELLGQPRLRRPDILLLQEMDLAGVQRLSMALDLNYVYGPAYRHSRHGKLWGNAVLSPWPIVGHRDLVLPHPNPFSTNHRRAIAADIQIRGQLVRAVSVHLSTVVIPLEDRLHQASVLADSLATVSYPVIIGGDFNTGSAQEIRDFRKVLRKRKLRQARLPRGKTALGGPLDFFGPDLVLDHFFYRGLAAGSRGIEPGFKSSDHFPVWVRFGFP